LQSIPEETLVIPEAIRQRLPAMLRRAAARSLQVDRTLTEVSAALNQAAIPAIFLKGAFFRTLYPSPVLRGMDDIDLLTPRDRLEEASQLITALGYERLRPLRRQDDLWLSADHHFIFRSTKPNQPPVELHWNLGGSDGEWRTPPLDWFWDQAVALDANEPYPIRTLSPTAQLLHQAAHQFLQHPERVSLKWLYDLHQLVTQYPEQIDWETAMAQAAAFHWSHALALALGGIRERFDTPLPGGVLARLERDADPRSIALFELANNPDSSPAQRAMGFLSGLPPAARWRHLLGMLFPSRKYLRWRYSPDPEWSYFLYYPYRWFVMTVDVLKTVGRRISDRR
jgi:hypothetical protein